MLLSISFFSTLAFATIVPFPYNTGDGTYGNPVNVVQGLGTTSPVSTACASALNQTLACDPLWQSLAASSFYGSLDSGPTDICDSGCNASLSAYHDAVNAACGTNSVFGSYPSSWKGDIIQDTFNLLCATDPGSGQYCPDWLQEERSANGNSSLLNLPESILCSSCQLSYFRTVQDSVFLGYSAAHVSSYEEVYNKCQVNYPTAPKLTPTLPGTVNGTGDLVCRSGKTYQTKQGDTCHSIASAQSVAEGSIWSLNNLSPACTTSYNNTFLSICLPNSCTTYPTSANDTCWSISTAHNITFSQFRAYNPIINPTCENLNTSGSLVCVSSPDGSYTPNLIPGSNLTSTGVYATAVVPAPGPTPFGTTSSCGGYYQVQVADICNRISLAASVPVDLFMAINPSIDAQCDNLVPNLWYCAHPLMSWNVTYTGNSTSPTTTSPAPGPTPPGTTAQCYEWHIITANETCSYLTETLGVTVAELVAWNPDLKADCSNLQLGDAYCVSGPPQVPQSSATPSTTGLKTTSTSTASSTSTSGSSCTKTHTVVSGDGCYNIWTANGLSEAQFRALNPGLDASCDLSLGEVLCVAGTPSAAPTIMGSSTRPSTQTASPTKTSSTSPSASACAKTYTVVSGDYCSHIESSNGLTDAQLRALNPTLDANCDIQPGQKLCVAAPSTCKKTYTVVSGDYCSKIEASKGLTDTQLRALNPTLDSNCDLQVGQKLCIG